MLTAAPCCRREWGGPAQETYLGQPRAMGSWCVYLVCALLCAAGQFYGAAHVQTEESKSKYLPYLSMMEDGDEKQLVSCTLHLLQVSPSAFRVIRILLILISPFPCNLLFLVFCKLFVLHRSQNCCCALCSSRDSCFIYFWASFLNVFCVLF